MPIHTDRSVKISTTLPLSVKGGILQNGQVFHHSVVNNVLNDLVHKISLFKTELGFC